MSQQADPHALNMMARSAVLANSVEMTQQIYSNVITPASQNIVNIAPRNVGLIKGFLVEVVATIANPTGATANLTDFNAANILSNISFTDLNNNIRINTAGWHLAFLASAKSRRVFGSSVATDSPIKYGSNWTVIAANATIAASGTGTVTMLYWVPLAYSDDDLRGAVYANVVNATMNLQLTINPQIGVASGDSTLAVYTGNPATCSSAAIKVWQVYLDQLPIGKSGPILPLFDLSTVYELKNTNFTGLSSGQDFPMPYANFRNFLSTFVVYNNGGTRTNGSDLNYWALQSANFTNIFQVSPRVAALRSRREITTDFPLGTYYFGHRAKPINTVQYGNMQLVANPAGTVNAGAQFLVGYEAFALANTISGAGSLPAN